MDDLALGNLRPLQFGQSFHIFHLTRYHPLNQFTYPPRHDDVPRILVMCSENANCSALTSCMHCLSQLRQAQYIAVGIAEPSDFGCSARRRPDTEFILRQAIIAVKGDPFAP